VINPRSQRGSSVETSLYKRQKVALGPKEIAVLTAAYADLLPDMLILVSSKTAIQNPAKDRPFISAEIEATFSL
jgi:hypothetical protein